MTQLAAMISRSARWFSSSPAVVEETRVASFRDVEHRSRRIAHTLRALAPRPGSRVALALPNVLEVVETDLAIIKAGHVKVPINLRLRHEERAHIVNDSGADVLVFDSSEEAEIGELVEEFDHPVELVRVGEGTLGLSYEDALSSARNLPLIGAVGDDSPSLILYTSGTTGRPKGATTSFAARLAGTINMLANEISPQPGEGMAHVGSMAHGSGSKVLAHFLRGSRNLPVARWEPDRFLDFASKNNVSHTFLVPTMINELVSNLTTQNVRTSSLQTISYGGAPIARTHLAAALEAFGPKFVQVYGSCEAPHPVLVLSKAEHLDGDGSHLTSAGRESTGYEVQVVASDGAVVPDGSAGELVVRGASMMSGYWGQPEQSEAALADGWYRTGDVVRRDEEGYIHIIDRARDMIITGGYNVYPAEIESVIARHPDVVESAVIGVPDHRWGEAVTAIVVARQAIDADSILRHCGNLLAGYKKPKAVIFAERLPRGPSGKVLRRQLRDIYWVDRDRRV